MGASAKVDGFHWGPYAAISLAILATAVLNWICLREAPVLQSWMGKNGMNAVTRIMGFLLICIAVQMVIVGSHGVLVDWGFVGEPVSGVAKDKFPF